MDKLRECPFCGEHATEIATCMQLEECAHFEECPAAEPYVCMVCSIDKGGCGASTGYYDSAEKAITAWNRRAQPENEPLVRCGECEKYQSPNCAAKHEQAEMEKGCTYCQKPYVSIGGINEDKAIIYLGAERPYTKGNVEYLHHMDSAGRMNAFKVRHCPMCGRKLDGGGQDGR